MKIMTKRIKATAGARTAFRITPRYDPNKHGGRATSTVL